MFAKPKTALLVAALFASSSLLSACALRDGGGDGDTDLGGYPGDGVTLRAVFIDVWQGDSALLLMPDGEVVLIDGGDNTYGNSAVLPVLEESGVESIDLVILTHPHSDHCGGLDEVLRAVPVAEVWECGDEATSAVYERFAEARDESGAAVMAPETGYSRAFGEVTLDVIARANGYAVAATGDDDGYNNDSLVVMVSYKDVRYLFAADAQTEEDEDILAAHGAAELEADVLKVPHHGSYDFAPDLPPTVDPTYAVISCGEGNDYGHPHNEALAAYNAVGATICRTDLLGTIEIATNGTDLDSSCH